MTFLTRFQINPARRQARFLLGSPQAMHAAVLSSFPPGGGELASSGRPLWRVDRAGSSVQLYLVSPHEPDLTHLVEQAGWPTTEAWATRSYDGFLDQLQRGQQYVFRLTANPVHQVRTEHGSKRFGHVTHAQQLGWLTERASSIGVSFSPPEDDSEPPVNVVVSRRERRSFRRQDRTVTLVTAQFDGRLLVTDPGRLRASLRDGIGRAKAYGCGLMTLARP